MTIRMATNDDLSAIVQVSGAHRNRLEALEPTFWRRHTEADRAQERWFGFLLTDEAHHILASTDDDGEIDGFIVARAMDALRVYDPGGRTA